VNIERKIVAVYPGRFQPMLPHHFQIFHMLKQMYGQACIVTSDKTGEDSPFNFKEKLFIAQSMFGLEDHEIKHVVNPYSIVEYADLFGDDVVVLIAVGEKDMEDDPRFPVTKGEVTKKDGSIAAIQPYSAHEGNLRSIRDHAYVIVVPTITHDDDRPISASEFRQQMKDAYDVVTAKRVFQSVYGKYNQKAFTLMYKKLKKEKNPMKNEINESRRLAGLPLLENIVDHGLSFDTQQSYDMRHGGPWDRGSADAYYGRKRTPHYFKGPSYQSERVDEEDMTPEEIEAYNAGYESDSVETDNMGGEE
jgi:hypothetical protein